MKMIYRTGEFLLMCAIASASLQAQWVQTNGPSGTPVWAVAANGTTVFAATDYGVARSSDNGASWSVVKISQSIRSISFLGNTVFAGAQWGIYRSSDNGMTWIHATNKGVTSPQITSMCSFGPYLFAGNVSGVYRSTDGGENWAVMSTPFSPIAITGLTVAGTGMFASVSGTAGGVLRSIDSGATWTKMSLGITNNDVKTVASSGTTVYAGCGKGEVFRSTDNAASWSALNTGLSDTAITSLTVAGSTIVAGTHGAGICRTTDNGASWTGVSPGLTDKFVNTVLLTGSTFIAGTLGGAFQSTDNAVSWTEANTGLVFIAVNALALSSFGTTIFAGCEAGGVYRSPDGGAHWYSPNTGLKKSNGPTLTSYALAVKGSKVIVAANNDDRVYRSTDDGVTWTGSGSGLPNHNVASFFISGSTIFAGVNGTGVYRSSDDGATWGESDAGLPPAATVNAFAQIGQYLFAALLGNCVYLSTDNGANWTAAKTGFPVSSSVKSLAVGSDNAGNTILFAGTDGYGMYRSTDNGAAWTAINAGLPQHAAINALARVGSVLFAGTAADSVFMSTDNGTSWIRANIGLADKTVNAFLLVPDAFGGADLYAGTGSSGVVRYTGNISLRANIAVTTPSTATVGTPFWVEVRIGDPAAVQGLYGISLKLKSSQQSCTYVSGSATAGPFLGTGPLTFFQSVDEHTVDMAVTKSASPGVGGSGVVAKAQFVSSAAGLIDFSIYDVQAINLSGAAIPLNVMDATVSVISSTPTLVPVAMPPNEPGQPFFVEVRIGQNAPVNGLYGISFKLKSDNSACTYVDQSAVAGSFLGASPVTFFRSVDPSTVDIGVSRSAPPGTDGSGVVAKAQFLSTVAGTVRFSVFDIAAIDQLGNPLSLDTASTTVTISSDPSLVPVVSGQVSPGSKFWIEARVGDTKAVQDLYGISFKLMSNSPQCRYVDGSAVSGSFLGSGQLSFFRKFNSQTLDASTTKSSGAGASGSGVLVRAQFIAASTGTVTFSFQDVVAVNASGATIPVSVGDLVLKIAVGQTTAVSKQEGQPEQFSLLQNYPNPFNPSTTISYQLPAGSFVSLTVRDLLGRTVATLVDEMRPAGVYTVKWDGSSLPSGVYFYTLKAGGYVMTKRMMLMK